MTARAGYSEFRARISASQDVNKLGLALVYLDASRLPRRTIAADVKHESRWCSVREAVTRRYIRLDTPTVIYGITLDLDAAGSHPWVWQDAWVPAPTWSAARMPQGDDLWPRRPHLRWEIEVPVVHPSRGGSRRAWATYEAVVAELRRRLAADTSGPVEHVAGRMSKNPDAPPGVWHVAQFREAPYSLTELARALELEPAEVRPVRRQAGRGLDEALASSGGRNDELFHRLRFHAYFTVGRFTSRAALHEHLTAELEALNSALPSPLPPVEIRSISKSVAGWTWRHRDTLAGPRRGVMSAQFAPGLTVSEKRVAAAHRTARLNRERHGDAVAEAHDRLWRESGRRPTQRAVAAAAGVSERTVRSRWTALSATGENRQNGVHQGPPAREAGVSGQVIKAPTVPAPKPGGLRILARLTRRLESANADPPSQVRAPQVPAPTFSCPRFPLGFRPVRQPRPTRRGVPAPKSPAARHGSLPALAARVRRREAAIGDPEVGLFWVYRRTSKRIIWRAVKGSQLSADAAARQYPASQRPPKEPARRRLRT